ncbi:hypothetical protein E6P97_00615 [Patescibacteria group bacterium]|nr:MAG: hypothetical protein E6P97_00615 [Patescibacteria group bacterium]
MTKQKKTTVDPKELEAIGQMLVAITETGYADSKRFYKMSFIKGVLAGFGGVLGATIVVALLLWFLSVLGEIPFLEQFVNNVETTIESGR